MLLASLNVSVPVRSMVPLPVPKLVPEPITTVPVPARLRVFPSATCRVPAEVSKFASETVVALS
ncbi:MAG TPA: hypothetical protein VN664_13850, partial [Burkholderiales bacterium]|nr:hypothetical protein [Burkholderiales bacterium]